MRATQALFRKPSFFITALVAMVIGLVEWGSTTAVIEDFEISPTLASDGVTSSMVSHALDVNLKNIQAIAGTAMPLKGLSLDRPPQFLIPGTGISLKYLIDEAKHFFVGGQIRVGGSIVTLDNQIQVTVRVGAPDGASYSNRIDRVAAGNCATNRYTSINLTDNKVNVLDAELSCTAEFILRYTQPYILAVYYQEIGDIDAAKELARFILYHPSQTEKHWALNLLGSIELSEAQNASDDRSRELHLAQATSYLDQSQHAFDTLTKAHGIAPFALAHVNHGRLYEYMRDHGNTHAKQTPAEYEQEARDEYNSAIQVDPGYGISYSDLARMLAREAVNAIDDRDRDRLWKQALDTYQSGEEHTRDLHQKAILLESWAESFSDGRKNAEAQQKLDSAIATDSTYAAAYFLKGNLISKSATPKPQEMIAAYLVATKLEPWNSAYAIKYALVLRDNGYIDQSVTELQRVADRQTADIKAVFEYGKTLAGTVKRAPERYALALEKFYEAYDRRMRSNPNEIPTKEDIEQNVLDLIRMYFSVAANASNSGESPRLTSEVLLHPGDRFLDGGYFQFANDLYREAAKRSLEASNGTLIADIIKRLETSAHNATSPEIRDAIIDLAWQYDPQNESLLIDKFMSLVANDQFDEAKSFALKRCYGKANFETVVKGWFSSLNCMN